MRPLAPSLDVLNERNYRDQVAKWLAEENAKIKVNAEQAITDGILAGEDAEQASRPHWLRARVAAALASAQRAARAEQERASAADIGAAMSSTEMKPADEGDPD